MHDERVITVGIGQFLLASATSPPPLYFATLKFAHLLNNLNPACLYNVYVGSFSTITCKTKIILMTVAYQKNACQHSRLVLCMVVVMHHSVAQSHSIPLQI